MIVELTNGTKLDLPTVESLDSVIDNMETELAKMRRLRKVVGELHGEKPTAQAEPPKTEPQPAVLPMEKPAAAESKKVEKKA